MRIDARHVLIAALVGCGISAVGTRADDGTSTTGGPDGGTLVDGSAPDLDASSDDGSTTSDGGLDGGNAPAPVIYVSTLSELWSFSPVTKGWKFLADTSANCPQIEELAVNEKGEIWAIAWTLRAIYKIDAQTYACAKVGAPGGSDPWSFAVTFVPKETFDAGIDTLVGYVNRDYIRIDLNGKTTLIGGNGLEPQMAPSGDSVSMGNREFVAIYGSAGCTSVDCLVEVDPRTGLFVKNWGGFPSGGVFALGHWGGKIYGFHSSGAVYEATLGASSFTVKTHPAPDGGLAITGAGSSTLAPTQ